MQNSRSHKTANKLTNNVSQRVPHHKPTYVVEVFAVCAVKSPFFHSLALKRPNGLLRPSLDMTATTQTVTGEYVRSV